MNVSDLEKRTVVADNDLTKGSQQNSVETVGADSKVASATEARLARLAPRRIISSLYDAESPAQATQSLAPYSLYALLLNVGFSEAPEIMALASKEQLARIVDLHCWEGTELVESQLWELFSTTDATESLDLLSKLIGSMDLKVIAYLVSKYVETIIFEEPTEQPPGDGYFTPDQGYTWVKVDDSDDNAYFQLNRALALIFESNAAVFYQLIALPTLHTPSALLEEALTERIRNIEGLGFPSADFCEELNAPLSPSTVAAQHQIQLDPQITVKLNEDQAPVHTPSYKLISALRESATSQDDFNSELQLIINAAILHWQIPFFDPDRLRAMTEGVLASIEIGIEFFSATVKSDQLQQLYEQGGLKLFYRSGLWHLRKISKAAWQIRSKLTLADLNWQSAQLIESLCQPIPCLPCWWSVDWQSSTELTSEPPSKFEVKQFGSLGEVNWLTKRLPQFFPIDNSTSD